MEIERASSPEFDEELLKPPEDKKEINEINGNGQENENENDVKDDVKDSEPINESADLTLNEEINESTELNETNEINGSEEINGDSETKSSNDTSKDEREEKEEEAMEQDVEPEPTPEPPEDKGPRLAEPLFEEELIDGFSFCSFDNYNVLEDVVKWSAQNLGKHPDPWYKLKFRPKEKPVKIKKEKPVKELTEKQKKKLEKVSSGSNSEKGSICDNDMNIDDKGAEGVGDHFSAQKPIPVNGLPHSQKRPNGIQQPGPINFSLPNPSRYPRPHPGAPRQPLNSHGHHQQQRPHSGLYRPYESSPTSSRVHPGQSPSHQNPAPRQIYTAPNVYPTHGNYPQVNHSNSQVHPAYRPPGTTTTGPVPAHHKPTNYSYPQGHQYQNYYQNHHNRQAYHNYHQSQQHNSQSQHHQQHYQHQQHQQHQQHSHSYQQHQQSHPQQQHHHSQHPQYSQNSLHTPYSHYGNAQHPSYPQKQVQPYNSSHLHGSNHSSQPSPSGQSGHSGHVLPNGLVQTSPTTGTTSTHSLSSPRGHSPNRERDSYSSNLSSHSGSGTLASSSGSITPSNSQHHKPNPWQSPGVAGAPQPQASHGNAAPQAPSAIPGQPPNAGPTPSNNQPPGTPTSSVPPPYPQSATLAPNPRLPTPGQRPTSSSSDILRQELDSRYQSSSERNLASTLGSSPYARGDMHQNPHQPTQAHHSSPHAGATPAILPPAPMMKDVPKLGGPDSLFYRAGMGPPGFPPRLPLTGSAASAAPFSAPGATATTTPKKTGKWNAMHVRIAWEIYNHQQKAKTDAKNSGNSSHGSPLGPPKHGSSFDLLNKPGGPPGADYLGKRPGPPQDLLRAHNPSSIFPGSMGLPTPPNPFDPLSRDPFGAQRFYGSSHLAAPSLAAAYPRYPTAGSAAPPFGGLGAIIPPGGASHLAHPRSNLGPPPLSSVPSTLSSQDRYSNYRAPVSTTAGWPLKSDSSLINQKEKERREYEEKERFEQERRAKEKREAEERERKQKEDLQRSRDSDIRNSREGFPAYVVKEKERNGDEAHRERSPLRVGSSPLVNASDSRTESPRVKPNLSFDANAASPLVKKDSESRSESSAGVDMRIGGESSASRPSSSLSHENTKPSDLSLKPSELTKKEEKIDNDISIIAEKEGNRSGANSVTGRTSVNSDHSISRLNGLDIDPRAPHRDHGSPIVTNGLKSDSPAMKHIPSSIAHQSYMYPSSQTRPAQAAVPPALPSSADLLGRSSYGLAPHHMAPPPSSMHDPRTLAMFPHLMGQSLRAPTPFDYPSLDPFRDPYRMDLLGRDPLREARERELMRLNPLGSIVNSELERAKALGLAGYPSLPTGYPGYPTATTLAAASLAHKMVPPHLSSLYSSPSIAPSLGFPHPGLGHAMGLNGVPGSNPQFNGKDPLRR